MDPDSYGWAALSLAPDRATALATESIDVVVEASRGHVQHRALVVVLERRPVAIRWVSRDAARDANQVPIGRCLDREVANPGTEGRVVKEDHAVIEIAAAGVDPTIHGCN